MMALKNSIDLDYAQSALTQWLGRQLPSAMELRVEEVVIPAESGISAETVLFDARWKQNGVRMHRGFVARVQPETGGVWTQYDLTPEFRLMQILSQHSAVVVPEAFWLEKDAGVLGAPFIVMERINGRVARDDPPFTATGWLLQLSPDEQAVLYDNGLQALAAVANIDPDAVGAHFVADMEMGAPTVRAHVAKWRCFFEWARQGDPNPTVEAAFDWLHAHLPAEPKRPSISWGDARLGNIIFNDDLTVAAVLDWELASLSYPEADLGWWLFLLRHHTEGIGQPSPPGFPDATSTIARWEQLTGLRASHLHYFEVFAATRLAVAMARAAKMMVANGQLPPNTPMALTNPAAQLLAGMLGLPAPHGDVQSFIGNRS